MSEFCSLCRCSNTPEHQSSGYHAFNAKLFADGKMPISEDSYNNFEKHRHEQGNATKELAVDDNHGHNVRNWHWATKDLDNWFIPTYQLTVPKHINLTYKSASGQIFPIQVRCTGGDGTATIQNRKGKIFSYFCYTLNFESRVVIDKDNTVTAKFSIFDISNEDLEDDEDISISGIKFEKGGFSHQDSIRKIIRDKAAEPLKKALEVTFKQMRHWETHPHDDIVAPQVPSNQFD